MARLVKKWTIALPLCEKHQTPDSLGNPTPDTLAPGKSNDQVVAQPTDAQADSQLDAAVVYLRQKIARTSRISPAAFELLAPAA